MNTQQLELGLPGEPTTPLNFRPRRKTSRATWWFTQMRQMVDRALDWRSAPPPRPEQTWFANTSRQVRV